MLEQLGLVGASWRQGGSEKLAEFALPQEHVAAQLQNFAQRMQLAELDYLQTSRVAQHGFAENYIGLPLEKGLQDRLARLGDTIRVKDDNATGAQAL